MKLASRARASVALALLGLTALPISAAGVCDPFSGICRAAITRRPVPLQAQQTPVWCWAASVAMIFGYYDRPVEQATIVTRYYGSPVVTTGQPWDLARALNTDWTDTRGQRFRVTSPITDLYTGLANQVTNASIVSALQAEKPVFYGDASHAMVLVQVDYYPTLPQPTIVRGWAIDPFPGARFGFRELSYQEMFARFVGIPSIQDLASPGTTPSIQSLVDIEGRQGRITPGSWATIYGSNLSATSRAWQGSDFSGQMLPTSLDGVRVLIGGAPAYIGYISPGQINFIVPEGAAASNVSIQLVNSNGSSSTQQAVRQTLTPSFFKLSQGGNRYAIATLPDGTVIAPPGFLAGAVTREARPGEIIALWMTGLGPTSPRYPEGQIVTQNVRLSNPISVMIGGMSGIVEWAGVVGAGLYQVNVRLPNVVPGDQPIQVTVGTVSSQGGTFLRIGAGR